MSCNFLLLLLLRIVSHVTINKNILFKEFFYEKKSIDVCNSIFEICTHLMLDVCHFIEIHRNMGHTFGTSANKITFTHAVKPYYMPKPKNASVISLCYDT
jgi:hypothetical protein